MFLLLIDLLNKKQIHTLMDEVAKEQWYDGNLTAPNALNKRNKQVNLREGNIVNTALLNCPKFIRYSYPKYIIPAVVSKYEKGDCYNCHTDAPFIKNIRNDLACTVFLAPPNSYEGGHLTIFLKDEPIEFKLNEGSAIIYPSHFIHEVAEVTYGTRVAAITFIESLIKDPMHRDLIYSLDTVINEVDNNEHKISLTYLSNNLKRTWG